MSDLTSALEHGRVIIHEHKTYVLNVLFPGAPDHPVGKDTVGQPLSLALLRGGSAPLVVVRGGGPGFSESGGGQ